MPARRRLARTAPDQEGRGIRKAFAQTLPALRPQDLEAIHGIDRAMDRVLHCVAPRGSDFSVATTARSTSASETVRGAPGRGSCCKPSQPSRRKRFRHLPTEARVVPSLLATAWSLWPLALSSTIGAASATCSGWKVLFSG